MYIAIGIRVYTSCAEVVRVFQDKQSAINFINDDAERYINDGEYVHLEMIDSRYAAVDDYTEKAVYLWQVEEVL